MRAALVFATLLCAVPAFAQARGGGAPAAAQPSTPTPSMPTSSGTTGLKGLRPSAHPPLLTLDQAFARALTQSFDLRIATARVDEAQSNVKKAWSAIMPQLSAGVQYTYNFPDQTLAFGDPKQFQQQALLFDSLADITAQSAAANPNPLAQRAAIERAEQLRSAAKDLRNTKVAQIEITPTNSVDGQLSFTVPLFSGRALPLLQNAYAGVDVAKIATRQARGAVVYGVARSYYQVVAAKRIADIAAGQATSAASHRDLAQQRLDQGLATRLTVQRAELDLARAQQAQQQANGGLKLAKGALGALVGQIEDFDVAEPPAVPAIEQGKSVDDLYARALAARDDLRIEKQALGIADRGKTDAWMRFLPTLALTASGRGTTNTGGLVSDPFTGSVGVAASIPIFDGGLTLGTLDEADAKQRQELLKVQQLQQTIEQEVRGTVDDLELKRAAMETAQRVADLARAQKAQVDDLFNEGAATGLDVSDATLAAFSADVDAARARFDVETARLGLAYALGELRPQDDLVATPLSDDEEKAARAFVEQAKD